MAAVARRTSGSTSNSVGNATSQDSAQELIQRRGNKSAEKPTTRTVLIIDTMNVISRDSSSGMTQAAERAGSLRRPKMVREDGDEGVGEEEGWFIEVP